jgi:hypothetical protein
MIERDREYGAGFGKDLAMVLLPKVDIGCGL